MSLCIAQPANTMNRILKYGRFHHVHSLSSAFLQNDFDSQCVLYGNVFDTTLMAGPNSNCNFVMFLQVVGGVMLSAGLLVLHVFALLMRVKGTPIP